MKKITLLMVGVGGYGGVYMSELLHADRAERFQIVGAVDPYAENSPFYKEIRERSIPIYDTVEEFYREHSAEMAVIATPIHLHAAQANFCMEQGTHVLCEKPICASLEDAASMMETRDRTGRKLAIGFQWSFSEVILRLKQDILEGVYGKVNRFRTIVYFPRDLAYYHRGSGWAGRRRLPSGELLLDSVASNATAHYLHNMLFLTGKQMDRSAEAVSMLAEVYRANPIEMFDTCALRVMTAEGAELLFYATHAVPREENRNPEFVIEGELGTVSLTREDGQVRFVGQLKNGRTIQYDNPDADYMRKLYCMADAVSENAPLSCVPETALPHLKCINALAEGFPETPRFPESFICYDEERAQCTCEGLGADLDRCWREGVLPSEAGMKWAGQPAAISMAADGRLL